MCQICKYWKWVEVNWRNLFTLKGQTITILWPETSADTQEGHIFEEWKVTYWISSNQWVHVMELRADYLSSQQMLALQLSPLANRSPRAQCGLMAGTCNVQVFKTEWLTKFWLPKLRIPGYLWRLNLTPNKVKRDSKTLKYLKLQHNKYSWQFGYLFSYYNQWRHFIQIKVFYHFSCLNQFRLLYF